MPLSKVLGIVCLVLGVVGYLGAVAGVFFAQSTPPLDTGAVSWLVVGVLFGLGALGVARVPA